MISRVSAPKDSNRALVYLSTFATNVLLMALGVVSGAISARALGPSARGELAALQFYPGLLAPFCALGFPERAAIAIGRPFEGVAIARRALTSVAILSLGVTTLAAALVLLLAQGSSVDLQRNTLLVLIFGLSLPLVPVQVSILRAAGQANRVNSVLIGNAVVYCIVVAAAWFLHERRSLIFALLGLLVPWISVAIYGHLIRRIATAESVAVVMWTQLAKDALRLFAPAAIVTLLSQLDRAILLPTVSKIDLGNFMVASAAVSPIGLGLEALAQIGFVDVGAANTKLGKQSIILSRFHVAQVVGLLGALTLFGTIRFLLPALYGHQFDSAVSIANWLIVAFTLRALQRVLEYMVRATDTARVGTVSSTIIAVVVLALGVPLAMHHGATGFAQALCAAYFVGLVVAVFMGAASMHGRVRDFWGIRLSSVLLLVRKLAGAARVIFPGRRV